MQVLLPIRPIDIPQIPKQDQINLSQHYFTATTNRLIYGQTLELIREHSRQGDARERRWKVWHSKWIVYYSLH